MEGHPKRHLLVPVDRTEASEKAVQWTLDHMYREGDMLHLFQVIPPSEFVVLSADMGVEEVIEEDEAKQHQVEDQAREYLVSTYGAKLDGLQVPYQMEIVRFATDNDSIGSIVCKRAEQLSASAVVMAKHNKGAVKEFFVGSCTSYVTRHCKSPVIVLHDD